MWKGARLIEVLGHCEVCLCPYQPAVRERSLVVIHVRLDNRGQIRSETHTGAEKHPHQGALSVSNKRAATFISLPVTNSARCAGTWPPKRSAFWWQITCHRCSLIHIKPLVWIKEAARSSGSCSCFSSQSSEPDADVRCAALTVACARVLPLQWLQLRPLVSRATDTWGARRSARLQHLWVRSVKRCRRFGAGRSPQQLRG